MKLLQMISSYVHRSVPYAVIIGETSSGIRWEQTQIPTARYLNKRSQSDPSAKSFGNSPHKRRSEGQWGQKRCKTVM